MIVIYEDTNGDQYRIKNVVACKDKGARKCL